MDIDRPQAGQIQNRAGQNFPVGDHRQQIRRQGRQLGNKGFGTDGWGLPNRQAEVPGGRFDRRRRQKAAPSLGPVRLGDHPGDRISRRGQPPQAGNGIFRGAHENDGRFAGHGFPVIFLIFLL